jgi:hypothetical protein
MNALSGNESKFAAIGLDVACPAVAACGCIAFMVLALSLLRCGLFANPCVYFRFHPAGRLTYFDWLGEFTSGD